MVFYRGLDGRYKDISGARNSNSHKLTPSGLALALLANLIRREKAPALNLYDGSPTVPVMIQRPTRPADICSDGKGPPSVSDQSHISVRIRIGCVSSNHSAACSVLCHPLSVQFAQFVLRL